MDDAEKMRLEAAGYTVGDASEVLMMTPAEAALLELRLAVVFAVRRLRMEKGLTQAEAGKLIGTSQAAFARLEMGGLGEGSEKEARAAKTKRGKTNGSLDLLFLALAALGGTLADLKLREGGSAVAAEFLSPAPRPASRPATPRAKSPKRKAVEVG